QHSNIYRSTDGLNLKPNSSVLTATSEPRITAAYSYLTLQASRPFVAWWLRTRRSKLFRFLLLSINIMERTYKFGALQSSSRTHLFAFSGLLLLRGSELKRIMPGQLLHKRSNGARGCLTLDATFESVANFVGRNRMETSSKTLRQSDQALSMTFIDRDPVPGDQSKVFDAEAELASNPFDHVVEKNGHPEAGPLTSKTAQWKRLEGNIEQKKFNAYHLYLSDLRGASLILHEGNREEWKSQEIYRANEKDAQAFFEHMNPDFKLGSKFNLYNFLIERSLSEQKLWWSKEDYEALQVKSDFQSDDVQLTIQVGDLIEPYLLRAQAELSAEEKSKVRNQLFELFERFRQSEWSYDKKWSIGPGRKWLIERFSGSGYGETRYHNFIKSLGSESHPDEWKQSLEQLELNLEAKQWAPPSLKFTWLDLGFEPDEMEELIRILKAYQARTLKSAFRDVEEASTTKAGDIPLQSLAYSAENMPKRFVELHRRLAKQAKKRRLMLKWISENLLTHDQIYESILNIGRCAAHKPIDQLRFKLVLGIHKLLHNVRDVSHSIWSWILDLFSPQKIREYFTPKK
ncbi:hypothetical protein MJO28_014733, partial [Puccinia striiformis f. sp. tritici]